MKGAGLETGIVSSKGVCTGSHATANGSRRICWADSGPSWLRCCRLWGNRPTKDVVFVYATIKGSFLGLHVVWILFV